MVSKAAEVLKEIIRVKITKNQADLPPFFIYISRTNHRVIKPTAVLCAPVVTGNVMIGTPCPNCCVIDTRSFYIYPKIIVISLTLPVLITLLLLTPTG
jgi:hypothetical protein